MKKCTGLHLSAQDVSTIVSKQVKTAIFLESGAEGSIAMEKALPFCDLLAENESCTVLYIKAQDVSTLFLEQVKKAFFSELGIEGSIAMEETTLAFRDLLAKTRQAANQHVLTTKISHDATNRCFWLLEKHSAAKGAVQCIETYHLPFDHNKGMSIRWPSAATTRKFYAAPERAYNIARCFEIGHTDFDETIEGWSDLRNGVLPNFPYM